MVITKLEYQKRNSDRVNLYLDGKFFCGISIDVLTREFLYEGLEIEEDRLQRIVYDEIKGRFFSRVLEYISKSPKTKFQVYRYLKELQFKKKGVWYKEDMEIEWNNMFDSIVFKLEELKYINDEEYARLFVQSRLRGKPRGKSVLLSELVSKGIDREIAQMVCDEEVTDEYEVLKNLFEKKFKGRVFDGKDSKMISFLIRKGFSWDLIERFKNDTEE